MGKYFDNSFLLYRIISEESRIELIYVPDEVNALDYINEESIWHLSFDDLLRETLEFSQNFKAIKSILERLTYATYYKGKEEINAIRNEFNDYYNDSNHILKYYITTFKKVFASEKAYLSKLLIIPKAQKTWKPFANKINILIDNLQQIAEPDFFSYPNIITKPKLTTSLSLRIDLDEKSLKKYVGGVDLVINKCYVYYYIADSSLLDFYSAFRSEIHKKRLCICNCKYCHKKFFGSKETLYCNASDCQTELKRLERNRKENERQNSPYKKPMTSLYNYISTYKRIFRKKIDDDPWWIKKFEEKEKEIKKTVRDEVKRREEKLLPPDDDEMNDFLMKKKHEMYQYMFDLLNKHDNH